jgi:hypothetical protein
VHWRRCPWSVPTFPRRTRWTHYQRRPPQPRHWWPDWKVRCWMIMLLTTILTFWISSRRSPRLFVGRAPSYRRVGLTQGNWTVRFNILDGSVFVPTDVGPAFLVLGHEDVEGGLRASLWLAPLIRLPLAILWTFWLDHPRWPLLSYDDLLALSRLGLRWLNQDLLPSSSTMFMFTGNGSLSSFIWGLSVNFNHPSFMAN